MDVLIDLERSRVFAGATEFRDHDNQKQRFGVSWRVAWDDKSQSRQQALASDPDAEPSHEPYRRQLSHQIVSVSYGRGLVKGDRSRKIVDNPQGVVKAVLP